VVHTDDVNMTSVTKRFLRLRVSQP
jgi:hypothetical protein